jgi:flavodoxin
MIPLKIININHMKTLVLSYSRTGNNEILAESVSSELLADHVRISEPKERTFFLIGLDMLFNRTPKVNPISVEFEDYDKIIFVGPVWMGHIATPFRAYLNKNGKSLKQYAYVSISGGADGPNTGLSGELSKRSGKEPFAVINLLISDILPGDPKPTREETESYRLNKEDARKLTLNFIDVLKKSE